MSMAKLYSVVIPVFNSEDTLAEVCRRTIDLFEKLALNVEIVLVNDCSKDKSWEIIKLLKTQYAGQITGVNLARNVGQHKALLCAFHQAAGDYIITIDDDLQQYPEDIKALISEELRTGADMVYGVIKDKKHSFIRKVGSSIFVNLFFRFANTPSKGSSFRLISRHVIDQVKAYTSPYIFLDEVLSWYCRDIAFADIRHENRVAGKSGYNIFKLIGYTIQMTVVYTVLPLRIITWFGLIAFFVCLFFVSYFIYMKYTYGAELGFTALIVSLFMSTGLILFGIGIIGEYIGRLFVLQSNKPMFIVKEIVK